MLSRVFYWGIVLQILLSRQMFATDSQPNIVIILADDMGSGDVHALNSASQIPTPHLDRLASEGMTFTDAHTPSAVCTPTRYGLLTGRYCWRTRLKSGVQDGYGPPLIDRERQTIAELLKEAGYHTGIVGKWHLGLGFAKQGDEFDFSQPVDDGPHTHGFDFSCVIPASLDFPPYLYLRNGKPTEYPSLTQAAMEFPRFLRQGERSPDLDMVGVLDELASQAIVFIEQQAKSDDPFFLYVPLTAPHKPVWPHPRFVGKTNLGPYGDFVMQVDATVGDIMFAMEDAGVADETLVIFTSDNGSFMYRTDDADAVDHVSDPTQQRYTSAHHTANGPYRGTKADIWEAGHRVPFFARWPGTIEPASRCDLTICLTDLFATAAEIVNVTPESDAGPDSFSILSLLEGADRSSPRAPVIHHSGNGMFAIRDGQWKLVLGNGSGGRQAPRGEPFKRPFQLFDLSSDLGEHTDVIAQHPDIAARLEQQCERIRDSGTSR
ncbi:MAG: arylsulfatase [Planctomycetaceae bacterium]|nr:arylsulfatase [Planctomycetaceae bacterium]